MAKRFALKPGGDKTRQIVEKLRRRILDGRYVAGQRLPSDRDMADELNVSNVTIAAARQELVNQGLLERSYGSGTYVVDFRARQHVAILMDFDLANPRLSQWWISIAFGARQVLTELGIPSQLYVGHRKPEEEPELNAFPGLLDAIENHRVSGLLLQAAALSDSWAAASRRMKLPMVGSASWFSHSVSADTKGMVRSGVEYLIKKGRRRIGLITFEHGDKSNSKLFESLLREAGVEVYREWIRGDVHPNSPGAGYQQFREIWTARRSKPDGLLITDDVLFRDAVVAIVQAGAKVPDDLLVVTHANVGSGIYSPFPVVKLEFDPIEYVRTEINMLRKLMSGETPVQSSVLVSHRLVEPSLSMLEVSSPNAGI